MIKLHGPSSGHCAPARPSRPRPLGWTVGVLVASLTLAACGAAAPQATIMPAPSMAPAPPPPDGSAGVRPGDVLRISVWPSKELGGDFPVEESGYVYLPIIGRIQATGSSLDQLRQELRDGYGTTMKNPVVTVTPLFRVSILGAVARPGLYNVEPTNTLFDLISMAGGFAPSADERKVRILRDNKVIETDAKRAVEQASGDLALALHSGDRIVVPTRGGIGAAWIRTGFTAVHSVLLIVAIIQRLNNP